MTNKKTAGVAIRTRNYLGGLRLPAIIWKPLVQQRVTMEDVRAVDSAHTKIIDDLAAMGSAGSGVTSENWEDIGEFLIYIYG